VNALVTLLLLEYAALGLVWLYAEVERIRERAAWRRLVLATHTQQPIANLAPPTCTELRRPDWVDDLDEATVRLVRPGLREEWQL
jgi:hypothetical protein